MPLTLRPAGLSSPAYRDWLDYVIVEDGRDVGRLYEDRHSKPELRWFWSITMYVDPKQGLGATTAGVGERTYCSAARLQAAAKGGIIFLDLPRFAGPPTAHTQEALDPRI
jgi:hypothetical protein